MFGGVYSGLVSVWELLRGVPWQWYVALAAGLGSAALVSGLLLRACSYRLILHLGDGKTLCERHAGDCKLELLPLPPRKGYRFVGWFADEACTEPVVGVLRVPRRGTELYARWKAELPRGAADLVSACAAAGGAAPSGGFADIRAQESAAQGKLPCADGVRPAAESDPAARRHADGAEDFPAAGAPFKGADNDSVVESWADGAENISAAGAARSEADGNTSAVGAVRSEGAGKVPAASAERSEGTDNVSAAGSRAEGAHPSCGERRTRGEKPRSASFIPSEPFHPSEPEPAEDEEEFSRALLTSAAGEMIFLRLRRSFLARLALADNAVQGLFREFRAALLTYRGVRERIAWGGASYMVGRALVARVAANAKSLAVYLALDPKDAVLEGAHFRDVSDRRRYAAVPVRCKVTGERSLRAVLALVRCMADRRSLASGAEVLPFAIPPSDRRTLTACGLIRVSACRENGERVGEEELRALLAAGATLEKFSTAFALRRMGRRAARFLLGEPTRPEPVRSTAARALVNLDTISAHYAAGERVDIASLREKGLVDRRATACKILARGTLDKPLTVEAEEFSLAAERLIAHSGGRAVRPQRGK